MVPRPRLLTDLLTVAADADVWADFNARLVQSRLAEREAIHIHHPPPVDTRVKANLAKGEGGPGGGDFSVRFDCVQAAANELARSLFAEYDKLMAKKAAAAKKPKWQT